MYLVRQKLASLLQSESRTVRPLQEVAVGGLVALSRWTPVAVRKLSGAVVRAAPAFQFLVQPLDGPRPLAFDVSGRLQELLSQRALREECDEELDALVGTFLVVAL